MPTGIYKRTKEHNLKIKNSIPRGKEHYRWKGDKATYGAFHTWLKVNFGKADRCENSNCEKKSINYNWALLKEKDYEHKRINFWMLCISCHRKYDFTEEIRENLSEAHKGIKFSEETKQKMSESTKKWWAIKKLKK